MNLKHLLLVGLICALSGMLTTASANSVRGGVQNDALQSEKRTVTGTVVDATTGEPIIGATIIEKGSTTNGTTSDYTGAFSITFHAAYYLGQDKEVVYKQVKAQISRIIDLMQQEDFKVWIRPETTGKATQWGDLDEVIRLSKDFENIVLPCIDFSHLHARSAGEYNTYDEFSYIMEYLAKKIGKFALDNFHGHLAGIEYTQKGERQHLNLEESDMNYKDLIKVMKEFNVKGALVCESPNIENDCKLLKDYYNSL